MELSKPLAPEHNVDEPLQTSNPTPESEGVQDSLETIRAIEAEASFLSSHHDLDVTDNLDMRLAVGRRRRAQTFSKVTNLFNKIFAE